MTGKGSTSKIRKIAPSAEEQAMEAVQSQSKSPALSMNGKKHYTGDVWEMDGFKFRLKKVSPILVYEVGNKVPLPTPPVQFVKEKERNEENPLDPQYQRDLQEARVAQGIAVNNAYFAFGTQLLEVPSGIDKPQDESWREQLAFVDIDAPESGIGRYVAWCKYYALGGERYTQLILDVQRFQGLVSEADVAEAEAAFRGDEERDTAEGTQSPPEA